MNARTNPGIIRSVALIVFVLSLASIGFSDDRTVLHPGFNLFSPEQDIQMGQRASAQVPRQYVLLDDKRVDDYLQKLGLRLAAHAPGYKYSYQYRCINSEVINAFALPGGFIYINRGVIENADDEAQLAAVMAHETSHVALRHGTNQATKAYAAQAGLSVIGALVGGNTAASFITGLFSGGVVPLVFLKMSRTDESEADILGTQILHDAGYDPYAMGQFFKKIEANGGGQALQFLSDHPSPENRVGRANEEANRLSVLHNPRKDSREFEAIKRYVKSLPPPPEQPNPGEANAGAGESNAPPAPSVNYATYTASEFSLMYPDNWQAHAQYGGVSIAPDGGIVQDAQANSAMAYGVIAGVFTTQNVSGAAPTVEQATQQFIANLRRSNPKISVMRQGDTTLGGQPALSTYLQGDSPAGGREADWLVTTLRPDGLFYVICVSPQTAFDAYNSAFRAVVHSVKFPN